MSSVTSSSSDLGGSPVGLDKEKETLLRYGKTEKAICDEQIAFSICIDNTIISHDLGKNRHEYQPRSSRLSR